MIHSDDQPALMPRRQLFAALGGIGASLLIVGDAMKPALAQTTFACLPADAMTEGPYWVEEQLNRSDIRADPSTNTIKTGTPLALKINLYQSSANGCSPLANAMIDIWHCDAAGLYSDEAANNTVGQKFLRGFQMTDSNGTVNFTTIYPGWYSGRAVHIHVRVRTYSGSTMIGQFVSQFFFDDSTTDSVFTASPYSTRRTRDTRNANDMVYTGATHPDRSLLTLTKTSDGYAASINTIVTIAGTTTTAVEGTRYAAPHISYGGGWYTALYLTNLNTASSAVSVAMYGESGSAVSLPSGASSTMTLAPNSTTIIELPNSGNLTNAWIDLTLPAGVVGYSVLRQSVANQADQEAVVPLNTVASQIADLTYDDTAFTTAVAVTNPGASSINVTATAYKSDGSQLGTASFTLAAHSKTSVALRNLSGLAAVSGTRGHVTFTTSSGSFALLGLRFGGAAFTTIPINYR